MSVIRGESAVRPRHSHPHHAGNDHQADQTQASWHVSHQHQPHRWPCDSVQGCEPTLPGSVRGGRTWRASEDQPHERPQRGMSARPNTAACSSGGHRNLLRDHAAGPEHDEPEQDQDRGDDGRNRLADPARGQASIDAAADGVADGGRTHNRRDHNPELCQLSYGHR